MNSERFPTLYLPHGGGPCFFMDWSPIGPRDTWDRMGEWLRGVLPALGRRPKAILVISAHWETPTFRLTGGEHPPLIYDYYGFPEHTYRLQYPAPGAPALAHRAAALLRDAGLPADEDAERGFDHGVFIPFMLVDPAAAIPVVQLSLRAGLDPAVHLAAGRALAPLRDEGVLIAGSGMSFHNMRGQGAGPGGASDQFDAWLRASVALPRAEREQALAHWRRAPGAALSHPREEHLLPLMVAAGAAGEDSGRVVFSDRVMGATVSAIEFGN